MKKKYIFNLKQVWLSDATVKDLSHSRNRYPACFYEALFSPIFSVCMLSNCSRVSHF